MTTTSSQTSQNALDFFENSQVLELFCESLVARFKLTSSSGRFPAKPMFLVLQRWKNRGKLLMEYTLYLKPQKKLKQNRIKSRKIDFVETRETRTKAEASGEEQKQKIKLKIAEISVFT